jgi:hypothetical protein
LLCAAGAGACFWKDRQLRTESSWLLARAGAQAQEYAASFNGAFADEEMVILEQRRSVLERAHTWQQGQTLFVIASVLLAFATYLLRVFQGVRPVGEARAMEALAIASSREEQVPAQVATH